MRKFLFLACLVSIPVDIIGFILTGDLTFLVAGAACGIAVAFNAPAWSR